MNIYISSSWKNRDRVRALAISLRAQGHEVYDFTDPACRKSPEIPPESFPEQFDPNKHVYGEYLNTVPNWRQAVYGNLDAIRNCDLCLLLLPCGADSHADWGVAVGLGKRTVVVGHPKAGERTPSHMWAEKLLQDEAEALVYLSPGTGGVMSRIDLKREVWLAVAAQQARLSTCLRAQVGCVLLRQDGSVAGTGYNGSLPGRAHCDPQTCNPTSRCHRTRHAERSALDYSSGPIWAAYVTHEPCLSCVKDLLARGCQQVYFSNRYPTKDPGESAAKRQHLRESFAHWVWCGEKMSYKCGLGLGTVWCTTCNDEGCDWCGFLSVPK